MKKPNRIRAFSWEPSTKAIRETLAKYPAERLSRADIQIIFGVENRTAQRIMKATGAELHAGCLFVDRREVQRYLAAIARSADYARDERRRERVQAAIEEAAKDWNLKSTATGIKQREFHQHQTNLPEGVTLAPGSLTIQFSESAELLRRLALFAAWCGQNQAALLELAS